ncbi:MAG: hypothetical protein ABI840_05005 [bacterium]
MSLKDKINGDLNAALKAKDNTRVDTLRSIRAEILKMDKSGMNRKKFSCSASRQRCAENQSKCLQMPGDRT